MPSLSRDDPTVDGDVPSPRASVIPEDPEVKDSVSWPEEIKCEMDIAEWDKALQEAGIRDKYADVIQGFTHGFDQGIPNHNLGPAIPYFTPPNHQSALLAQDKIEASIAKELEAGRMYGPYTHTAHGEIRILQIQSTRGSGQRRRIGETHKRPILSP
jgi:hypothetical protein